MYPYLKISPEGSFVFYQAAMSGAGAGGSAGGQDSECSWLCGESFSCEIYHPPPLKPTHKTAYDESVEERIINEEYKIWKKNTLFLS